MRRRRTETKAVKIFSGTEIRKFNLLEIRISYGKGATNARCAKQRSRCESFLSVKRLLIRSTLLSLFTHRKGERTRSATLSPCTCCPLPRSVIHPTFHRLSGTVRCRTRVCAMGSCPVHREIWPGEPARSGTERSGA